MERSYEAQKRGQKITQLRNLAALLTQAFAADADGLRPHDPKRFHRDRESHDAGEVLENDARAAIVAAATILAAARTALELRRGGSGPELGAGEAPMPRVGNGGAYSDALANAMGAP